ncbi:hypothetical protein HAX54_011751 [Datura stramonium]|uniref:Uncharacterized protein n=1 Tax=Datura stramonium TaxID=4076 RepID=A0ABS8TJH2_DATST|nr:hypothetical protein [Datura stramonium]
MKEREAIRDNLRASKYPKNEVIDVCLVGHRSIKVSRSRKRKGDDDNDKTVEVMDSNKGAVTENPNIQLVQQHEATPIDMPMQETI